MVLNRVYVIPHGDEILDKPNEESKIMFNTIKTYTENDDSPYGVIISPHSVRLSKGIAIINTEYLRGTYKLKNGIIRGKYKTFRELNEIILNNCPDAVELNFITNKGPLSVFPLDFGSLIPLKFFKFKKITLIGQPRIDEKEVLKDFGKCLFKAVEEFPDRISVIFSADQAHTHSSTGPYGYSEYARYYDQLVIDSIKGNDFHKLQNLEKSIIESAKPDSYWNMLILASFLDISGRRLNFRYYYVEKYFGMLFADG